MLWNDEGEESKSGNYTTNPNVKPEYDRFSYSRNSSNL